MRKLFLEQTPNTPKVLFDPETSRFEISGESRPANVAAFYLEILAWFDEFSLYLEKSPDIDYPIIININFGYFNSASAKYILDLCKLIGNINSKGKSMEIKWLYDECDRDMLEAGKELSRLSRFSFDFVKRK